MTNPHLQRFAIQGDWSANPMSEKPHGDWVRYRDVQAQEERWERVADALQRVRDWCRAYPLEIFPEPDLKRAHEVLTAHGMTLDAISASNMRHIINGMIDIVNQAVGGGQR